MSTFHYFAYGSNLSFARLRRRTPSARVLSIAMLQGHRLVFHKASRDGSAKCDAALTDDAHDLIYGVVYEIDAAEKPWLDEAEGLGKGYGLKSVTVQHIVSGSTVALTYCATHIDPMLKPYSWYKEHVLRGATEHGLPEHYIAAITAVDTIDDPDRQRHTRELEIY